MLKQINESNLTSLSRIGSKNNKKHLMEEGKGTPVG